MTDLLKPSDKERVTGVDQYSGHIVCVERIGGIGPAADDVYAKSADGKGHFFHAEQLAQVED